MNDFSKQFRAILLGTALVFTGAIVIASQPASAQITSGAIVGNVVDSSGAAIPNATVKVVNIATGVETDVKTNGSGEFRAPNLPAGNYNLTASASGFSTYLLKNFQVQLNNTATIKLVLPVASATTSVEVSSEASVTIDTTTVQLQTTFEKKELQDLPTASIGLGVLNLSLLSPGVATSGGIGAGTGPSVGGQRPRENNYTIEGIDNNDKSVTGPLVYVPNDAVGEFTLITNQFSPEFGHSAGGQFNTIITSGTNSFHGRVYEYFQNRNLNAIDAATARTFAPGVTPFNPRYDNNRFGGQIGGPILKDKLFFFTNYEQNPIGQSVTGGACTPTAAGLAAIAAVPGLYGPSLGILQKYVPASPGQVSAAADNFCGALTDASGNEYTQLYSGVLSTGTATTVPLGNYQIRGATYTNNYYSTNSIDWTISPKDAFRARYIYNRTGTLDTAAQLPAFWTTIPFRYNLVALSEYHNFTPNLINEARIGFNRYSNTTPAGNLKYPGLAAFPNITLYDLGGLNIGPDPNAPQSTIQNLYQLVDNISWVKGNHTLEFGFDGRKYISPQSFTQRVRGDYYWGTTPGDPAFFGTSDWLHDLSPTNFGERSTGDFFYYGDQTALYGFANDTWRVTPTLTLNYGLRYEFTSVPVGERTQQLNAAASVPGLIQFTKPKPQYKNFAPRLGVAYAPNPDTSIRAGFGLAYDVLYDNLGILSFPPQFSSTNDTSTVVFTPNFLANGGLPAGTGTLQTFPSIAAQRAATSGYIPNQKLPYAETWSLGIQHVFAKDYTAEVRYLGTRGIHLPIQVQLNKQDRVDATNNLPTYFGGAPSAAALAALPNTLATIKALPALIPAYADAGLTSNITSFQPYSESNYNGLALQLTRRFQRGLQLNFAYTYSKTMDDATADVYSTLLTPRRPQDFQHVSRDYSRSALDRTHRLTLEAIYDFKAFQNRNWLMKNVVGNWEIAPIYTYQSPEYGTVLSGQDSNLNGDSAPDRVVINRQGVPGTGSGVSPVYDSSRAGLCGDPTVTQCSANLVAYTSNTPNAYYVTAGLGVLPTASRNTLPIRPIDDVDVTAVKRVNITERYSVEFQAQAINVLNHPQFLPGSINTVNSIGYTDGATHGFLEPSNTALFNQPQKVFSSNSRTMQLAAKFIF